MGLNSAFFRKLADKLVLLAGDIRKSVTYTQVSPGDYNTETGATVDGAPVVRTLLAFPASLDEMEMSWFPAPEKVTKLLIPYGTWAAAGITAKRNDYVDMTDLNGVMVRWEVKRVYSPPSEAFTKLYIESP